MARYELKLTQLSMGMTDGQVIQWYKNEGDRVVAGEGLLEVDTGKVLQDIESPETGTVSSIKAQVDDILDVGGTLCVITTDD